MDDSVPTPFGQLAVRRAARENAPEILRLRDELAAWMVERDIEQWRAGEMPLAWIEECAVQDRLFAIWRDGILVASVTLAWVDPFIWSEQDERAGYVHMLMVDRAYAGHQLGRSLLGWAERSIARSGFRLARLDCVRTNVGLRAYYEDAGYHLVGYKDFDGSQRSILRDAIPAETALYEKALVD